MSAAPEEHKFEGGDEMSFKEEKSFERRRLESDRVLRKFPRCVPIICERAMSTGLPRLEKAKFIIPRDLTLGQFSFLIHERLSRQSPQLVRPTDALFLFCGAGDDKVSASMPPIGDKFEKIYDLHKDEDGFLYIKYARESTFGH